MKTWITIGAAAVLTMAGSLRAAPLDEARLGADAKWVAHVDFDALRASTTVRAITGPWLATDRVRRELAKIRDTVGLDPTEDLHGLTFYGPEPVEGRGVALVTAEVDRARLETFLAEQPDYAAAPYEKHVIHSWTHHRPRRADVTIHGCLPDVGLVLFSQDLGDLRAAVDVLDGRRPNLAAGDSPLKGAARPGTILDLRAAGLAEAKLPLKSPILRLSELLTVALGEQQSTAFVEARLVARSEQNASDMRDVVAGAIAFARLYCDGNDAALDILDAIRVESEARTVTLTWEGQARQVLKVAGQQWMRTRGGNR